MRNTNYKEKALVKQKIRYRQEMKSCILCDSALKQISTNNRNLTNIETKSYLSIQVSSCTNPKCENHSSRLMPVAYIQQIVPNSGYGIDVYSLILPFAKNQHGKKTFG